MRAFAVDSSYLQVLRIPLVIVTVAESVANNKTRGGEPAGPQGSAFFWPFSICLLILSLKEYLNGIPLL